MFKNFVRLAVVTSVACIPAVGIPADWQLYGETSFFKAFIDYDNIKKINEQEAFDVWTQWELTKQGKVKMLPKKHQQAGSTLRAHWRVDCEEKTMLELSNYLFDKKGALLVGNERVQQRHEMIPGTLSEDFIQRICSKEDTSDDKIEGLVKDGVLKFNSIYEEEGLMGVSSHVVGCYETARTTNDADSMIGCATADIVGMLVDAGVAESNGWPETLRNQFFMDAKVKDRVRTNLSGVGIDLDDEQLDGLINRISGQI